MSVVAGQVILLMVNALLDFLVAATMAYFVRMAWWLRILIALVSVFALGCLGYILALVLTL